MPKNVSPAVINDVTSTKTAQNVTPAVINDVYIDKNGQN